MFDVNESIINVFLLKNTKKQLLPTGKTDSVPSCTSPSTTPKPTYPYPQHRTGTTAVPPRHDLPWTPWGRTVTSWKPKRSLPMVSNLLESFEKRSAVLQKQMASGQNRGTPNSLKGKMLPKTLVPVGVFFLTGQIIQKSMPHQQSAD